MHLELMKIAPCITAPKLNHAQMINSSAKMEDASTKTGNVTSTLIVVMEVTSTKTASSENVMPLQSSNVPTANVYHCPTSVMVRMIAMQMVRTRVMRIVLHLIKILVQMGNSNVRAANLSVYRMSEFVISCVVIDCEDQSDEPAYCNVDECQSVELNQCEHKCVNTLTGFHCECYAGYKLLKDGKACEDINECYDRNGNCSQYCINTPGSYLCKCNEQYYSRAIDGKTCKRNQGAGQQTEPWMIFSNRYYLRNMSHDGHLYQLIKMELKNVVALDFDYKEERLYYADVGNKTINRIFMNGTGEQVIVRHDAHGLEG